MSKVHEIIVENQTEAAVEHQGGIKNFLQNMAVIKYQKNFEESPVQKKKKRKMKHIKKADDTSSM